MLTVFWYVVPTGRVIATVSIKVPTSRYIVPAGYIISPGLKDLSRAETYKFVWYSLGAGSQASTWFDRWCSLGPLSLIVSSRDIHQTGFNMGSRVRDIVADGVWKWPPKWYIKYLMLGMVTVPVLNPEARDVLE
ncbi:hypothetical protein Tco_1140379 [Tanacetum coccineum]